MKNTIVRIILLSAFLIFPFTSSAEESQSKTYFTAGMVNMTDKWLDPLKGTGVTIKDSSALGSLTVGYKVSPNLALEAGIISGGETSATLAGGESGTLYGKSYSISGALKLAAKSEASYLFGLKYSAESGPFSINATGGMLYWDIDYIVSASGTLTYDGTTYSESASATFLSVDGSDPYMGIGVSYLLENNSSINLDYIATEMNNSDNTGVSVSWTNNF